jgi:hypothetical protein
VFFFSVMRQRSPTLTELSFCSLPCTGAVGWWWPILEVETSCQAINDHNSVLLVTDKHLYTFLDRTSSILVATCVQPKHAAVLIREVTLCADRHIHYVCYTNWDVPYKDERFGLIFFYSKIPWGWHSSAETYSSLILATNCILLCIFVG